MVTKQEASRVLRTKEDRSWVYHNQQRVLSKAMVKFLQINSFRRRPCHDLVLAMAKDMDIGVILMSEPNRNAIKNRKDWFYDDDLNTAIKVDDKITIRQHGKGYSFSYIVTPTYTIYNCYTSPNEGLDDLERILYDIGSLIRFNGKNTVVVPPMGYGCYR